MTEANAMFPVIEVQDELEFVGVLKAMTDQNGILHVSADTLIPQLILGHRAIELNEITKRFMNKARAASEVKDWETFVAAFSGYLDEVQCFNAKHRTRPGARVN